MADYFTEIKPREDDAHTVAQTLYGETRGDMAKYPHSARALYEVMDERTKYNGKDHWGDTPAKVAKGKNPGSKYHHFSAWNEGDPNRAKMMALKKGDPKLDPYMQAQADTPLPKEIAHLKGATHYHATSMKKKPYWASKLYPYGTYGSHTYYSYKPKPGQVTGKLIKK